MPKTKTPVMRVGPINHSLLPIPDGDAQENGIYELYQMGDRGGWGKDELPEEFWDELNDLVLRYGGIDGDGDARLSYAIVDRTQHDTFHFMPIKKGPDFDDHPGVEAYIEYLHDALMNQGTANAVVERAGRLLAARIAKEKKEVMPKGAA